MRDPTASRTRLGRSSHTLNGTTRSENPTYHWARSDNASGRAGKAYSVGWNVIPNEIAALKNGTQIALFDQNWPQQAAFGAVACAHFMATGKILPNTQQLTIITKANLASAQKKLADFKSYALNGLA